MKHNCVLAFTLCVLVGVRCTQQLSFIAAPIPTPTPTPPGSAFDRLVVAPSPRPIPSPPGSITAVIPSPTPDPSPPFRLDLDFTAKPSPSGNPPFAISPIITAPTPGGDTCDTKLDKLQECLTKKADFVALGLTHYSYDIQRSCFCFPPEFTQQVSVSVCGADQSEPQYYTEVNTMIKVFDFLCDAIKEADSVDVTYDGTYHFPSSIFVDYIELAIDDENSYTITNFQVLTPQTCTV